jgi:cation:H+ antiporter
LNKRWLWIALFIAVPIPWIIMKYCSLQADPLIVAIFSGGAIVGAAFLLSWIAEVAQMDIPQALALAAVALIAVLPEYAVDMYFAWMAGKDPSYCQYALANMTGSNRLLIGGGWAFVIFVYYLKSKKREISLEGQNSIEISSLLFASLYALILPLKNNLSIIDAFFFIMIFIFYLYNAMKCKVETPEISGPHEAIAELPPAPRRSFLIFLFLFAGFAIYIAAAPFAESLIATGRHFKIDEFLLVQWIAPLASESPEFIVATLFALNGHPRAGIGCLISSKVNQWTLLVGMLPLVYVISAGKIQHLGFDPRQTEEIFLTTTQSLFALAIIAKGRVTVLDALVLFTLFITQLIFTHPLVRWIYSGIYCILFIGLLLFDRSRIENLKMTFTHACRMGEQDK